MCDCVYRREEAGCGNVVDIAYVVKSRHVEGALAAQSAGQVGRLCLWRNQRLHSLPQSVSKRCALRERERERERERGIEKERERESGRERERKREREREREKREREERERREKEKEIEIDR